MTSQMNNIYCKAKSFPVSVCEWIRNRCEILGHALEHTPISLWIRPLPWEFDVVNIKGYPVKSFHLDLTYVFYGYEYKNNDTSYLVRDEYTIANGG